jgi:cysteinyl-tRNA synthetase
MQGRHPDGRLAGAGERPAPTLTLGGGPCRSSPARIYVCGITPYDVTHLSHSTFVWPTR